RYALDTRGLKSGHHTVMVKETSTNGETSSRSVTINVRNLPARGEIDTPKNGTTLWTVKNIEGWYLDGDKVSKIEIYVDGKYKGLAEKGLTRPDVKRVFPEYEDGNSGFRYALDTRGLKSGHHTVMVKETSTNGE
ncbi:Ig-like domain-containing protein, partial [Sporolactobacillus terrae]|uniref:Ig-like domain-containing protein n=1 Tax=Sporolactobacillus terrae TaxID=269673 RepID=UPI00048C224E